MKTKQQLLTEIEENVAVRFDLKPEHKDEELPLPNSGGRVEYWDVPVSFTINAEGCEKKGKQRIKVGIDGSNNETGATYVDEIVRDYKAPTVTVEPDINQKMALYYGLLKAMGAIKDFKLLKDGTVSLAGDKKGAQIEIVNHDDTTVYKMMSYDENGTFKIKMLEDNKPDLDSEGHVQYELVNDTGIWDIPLKQ